MKLLDSLPGLVEEYIRETPSLVHGREGNVRDYAYTEEHQERKRKAREEGRLPTFPVLPEMFRERYRAMYELLGLKVTATKDTILEVRGTFGVREMRLGTDPSSVTWRAVTGEGAEEVPLPTLG